MALRPHDVVGCILLQLDALEGVNIPTCSPEFFLS